MKEEVNNLYGNKVRVRVCGICIREEKILLINHSGVGETGNLWVPPGGGVNFGESVEETLVREYKEETGLEIEVKEFLFVNEHIVYPLHAIELFFKVEITGGIMIKGIDPEMETDKQIIQEVRYWSFEEMQSENALVFHTILRNIRSKEGLFSLKGFFTNF